MLLPLFSVAQRLDLDRFNFTAEVRTLPRYRLDTSYHTYDVQIETTKLMQNFMAEMTPEQSVFIDGWRKLEKQGHLTIKVRLEDLLPEGVSNKERVEPIKDKTGKQIGTRNFYYQEVTYTFAATAEVYDYKGAFIRSFDLANRSNKMTYRSPEFAIGKLAEGYFLVNSLAVTSQLFRSNTNRVMRTLSDNLTDDYGYSIANISDFMWIIDTRKHAEYQAHRVAFQKVKEVIFDLNAHTPIEGLRERLKPAIDYFDMIKRRYSGTSKHDRKIRYASYFNLAVIYYYLDDPQNMLREATGLIMNDFDAQDGRNLEANALRLKNIFQNTGIYTRHFPLDVNKFKGPFEGQPTAVTAPVTTPSPAPVKLPKKVKK